jgi:hypothetical protein
MVVIVHATPAYRKAAGSTGSGAHYQVYPAPRTQWLQNTNVRVSEFHPSTISTTIRVHAAQRDRGSADCPRSGLAGQQSGEGQPIRGAHGGNPDAEIAERMRC